MCKPREIEVPENEPDERVETVPGWKPDVTPDPGPREPSRRELPGPAQPMEPARRPGFLEPVFE